MRPLLAWLQIECKGSDEAHGNNSMMDVVYSKVIYCVG